MDDMSGRRSQLDSRRRRHQDVRNYGHHLKQSFAKFGAFFKTHKQSLLAIALLAILTLLLFGILQHFCGTGESWKCAGCCFSGR